ncbi:hypothetical protein DMC30DRAFT_196589 [Rhodotorula diobovata]|uniref:Uncharacterized protein n=1 Tax=Rhodotorula diobovata TaxID=5288 RepID=A0A5C5FZ23_9BASI|nr:hypothetical protein DMC30DRAFT_196589 [Rhodotorula diobovata]
MPVTTEETLALVHSLSAYVSSTLASLSQPPTASPSSLSSTTPPPPTLSAIRSDLSLLFQDCNKHLTASALALKPPASLDALHGSLAKLDPVLAKVRFALDQLPAPAAAAEARRDHVPAAADAYERGPALRLARKVRWSAREVLEAVSSSLSSTSTLLLLPKSSTSTAHKSTRDALLVALKALWSTLERFEALPRTELDAERAAWRDTLGLLDDCAEEVRELAAREAGGTGAREEGEDEEDEEEEDEEPLTAPERARAQQAAQIIRLARLVLAHLYQRTTAPPSSASASAPSPPTAPIPAWTTPALLARAAAASGALSSLSDELAACLEPGQDADEVDEAAGAVCAAAEGLAEGMERALGGAGEGKEDGGEEDKDKGDREREWLAMWRRQCASARDKLAAVV